MAYSSIELVKELYPDDPIEKMGWLIENYDNYAVSTLPYIKWQVITKGRYFIKRANGWIEVDKYGKIVLQKCAA